MESVESHRREMPALAVLPTGQAVVASNYWRSGQPQFTCSVYIEIIAGMGIFTEFPIPHDNHVYVAPQVACLPDGRIFCTAYNATGYNLAVSHQYRILDPLTGSFSEHHDLFPGEQPSFRSCTVSSPSGQKVATVLSDDLQSLEQEDGVRILCMESTDGGVTFGETVALAEYPTDFSQEVFLTTGSAVSAVYDAEENLHVVWDAGPMIMDLKRPVDEYFHDYMMILHDCSTLDNGEPIVAVRHDTARFIHSLTLTNYKLGNFHTPICFPKIGRDEDGILTIVFTAFIGDSTDCDPVTGYANGEIFAVSSADNGLTWGEPTNLTNTPEIDERYAYLSQWNEAGKINILYQSDPVAGANVGVGQGPASQCSYLFLKTDTPSTEPYQRPTGVEQPRVGAPERFAMQQNYPNPFNAETTIAFSLSDPAQVRLTITDVLGQTVAVLLDEAMGAGPHKVRWHAGASPSGLYFATLQADGGRETQCLLLLK